jgi:hypothetical protein
MLRDDGTVGQCFVCGTEIGDPGPCINHECEGATLPDATAGYHICLICSFEQKCAGLCSRGHAELPLSERSERTASPLQHRLAVLRAWQLEESAIAALDGKDKPGQN